MKQDINEDNDTINNMINLMTGSPHSDKQINSLIFLLRKINVEQFPNKKMDEILNLFVVVYLKCSPAVQLTFVDDIDKCMCFIRESQQKLFIERAFEYNAIFYGIY